MSGNLFAGLDPNDPRNVAFQQGQDIEALKQALLEMREVSEITPSLGAVSLSGADQITAGGAVLGENGQTLTNGPSDMAVNFWASIGVPSNVVTGIAALAVSGTKVYVGGNFTKIGGIAANYIAVYDIVTGIWSALGTGLSNTCNTLSISGSNLYAGGDFTLAGGVANTSRIAKWNGAAWSALGTGLNGSCYALYTIGTDLYAGGTFTLAGGVANTSRIAKWNGSAWSALGTGLNDGCFSLNMIGTDLYAGGDFTLAGGVANTSRIAKWNGAAWSALGTGLNSGCRSLASIGTDLYAGGLFTLADGVANTSRIAKWDGTAWSALGIGLNGACYALAAIDTNLYAGGAFTLAGETSAARIARRDGENWFALGSGLNGDCTTIAVYGTDLYVGGGFTAADGRAAKGIAAYLTTLQSVLAYLEITQQALQDALVTDVTLYDASTSNHGLLKKLDGSASHFMAGDGTWKAATAAAADISMPVVGTPTLDTLAEDFTTRGSSGVADGTLTYITVGSTAVKISVAAGEGYIRTSNDQQAALVFCKWSASVDLYTFSAPAAGQETAIFVGISYNAGTPIAITSTTFTDFNGFDKFWLGRVSYDGTTMRILNSYAHAEDVANGTRLWMRRLFPFQREEAPEGTGGLELSSSLRALAMTTGAVWHGYNRYLLAAVASGSAFDTHYKRSGGGFNKTSGVTAWPNTQYDNGSGTLQDMNANRYGTLWVYVDVSDGSLDVVYGAVNATSVALAQADTVPSTPNHLTYHGKLIGRIIFQKSAASATLVESAWSQQFAATAVGDHNLLTNLQGGTANEYYHLTSAQQTVATQAATAAQNGYATSTQITKLDAITGTNTGDNVGTSTTFTPVISGTSTAGAGTYTTQAGAYWTIGKMLFFKADLVWTAHTGTGNMIMTGLPIAAANDGINSAVTIWFSNITLLAVGNKVQGIVAANTSQINFSEVGSGAASLLPIDAAASMRISGCYLVA